MKKAEVMAFRFQYRQPSIWTGRYHVIPGKQSVLHVRWDDSVDLIWKDGPYTFTCQALMTDDLKRLGQAINRVKRQRAGQPGGSFVINEYGQVLCPVNDDSFERFWVGDCRGSITFIGADNELFTLNDDTDLTSGDEWGLPYIGIPHNLSAKNKIYFTFKEGYDTEFLYPPYQDQNLIGALRNIRGPGGCKFIVNPHGIVLTKVEVHPFDWRPKFVGRLNYQKWFPRENA